MKEPLNQQLLDEKWMSHALKLAAKASSLGEVPVAALLIGPDGKTLLAQSYNHRESWQSPLAHAEVIVLHTASKKIHNWRLENCTLYVTLEPCLMCAGALLQSRVKRVVYGVKDPKSGAVDSLYKTFQDLRLNHQIEVTAGILEQNCVKLLQDFFKSRREEHKIVKQQKIYRRRASVIVVHQNKVLGFHAMDPTSKKHYFFMPGGKIEKNESAVEAAIRETLEETGYKIRILPNHELRRRYDFEWDGRVNHCDTSFFVGILDEDWFEPVPVKDAPYNKGPQWLPVKNLDDIFNYHPDILWGARWGVKKSLLRPD
ncbi:MAG TPA: tRNA adenosine(34) deaminase TadA [Pseudobdellovibrionaceae bacterium]